MNWKRIFQIGVPLLVLGFMFVQAKKELEHVSFYKAFQAIQQISIPVFIGLIILGCIAVATMTLYDFLLVRYLRIPASKRKIFSVSWIANTTNGIFGFGGAVGVFVRTYFYQTDQKKTSDLVKSIVWMTVALMSGLSFLSFFVLCDVFPAHPLLELKPWLWFALIGVCLFLPLYMFIAKFMIKNEKASLLTFQYTGVSIIEWVTAAALNAFILHKLGAEFSIPVLFGIFFISAISGLISMIPGGFGAFDMMYLIGMKAVGVDPQIIITGLILYRLVYYLIPFMIGMMLACIEYFMKKRPAL